MGTSHDTISKMYVQAMGVCIYGQTWSVKPNEWSFRLMVDDAGFDQLMIDGQVGGYITHDAACAACDEAFRRFAAAVREAAEGA